MRRKRIETGEIWSFFFWFVLYLALNSLGETWSMRIGVSGSVTLAFDLLLSVGCFLWIRERGRLEHYGLCRARTPARRLLWYLPLWIVMTGNLWLGVQAKLPLADTLCNLGKLLCVGFLEELLFRGFLYRAVEPAGAGIAIAVSSLAFGLSHLINLFNGSGMDVFQTALQIVSAAAIGFAFAAVFYRSDSLLVPIVVHCVINALSIFAKDVLFRMQALPLAIAAIQIALLVAYGIYVLKVGERVESRVISDEPTRRAQNEGMAHG